jgi:hypothetical protein
LSKKPLNENAEGVRAFRSIFAEEYTLFETFTRNLVNGRANFGVKTLDYIGTAIIGTLSALASTTTAILAGLGILTAFYSLGLGFFIAILGVGMHTAFNWYRNHVKEKKCIDAVEFIESEEMIKNVHDINAKISHQFSDYLNHCTAKEARQFAKKAEYMMADAIMEREVKTAAELTSPTFMQKYQKLITVNKPAFSMIDIFKRLKQNIIEAWCGKKKQENVTVSVAAVGMFSQKVVQINIPVQKEEDKNVFVTEIVRPRM